MQNHYCSLKTNRNVMLICLREKFAYDTTNESLSCLNTEILHTVLTIKRLKWEQEMYLIASLALILNFEF